jgi:CRISPR-associated protein Csx14
MTGLASPDISINVDLRNPGQFFACCGLLELTSRLWPAAEESAWNEPVGWFEKAGAGSVFRVTTGSGHNDPLGAIVARLCESPLAELAHDHETQKQADRKPVVLKNFGLRLDWWLDGYRGGDKSELKVWAGQMTPERNLALLQTELRTLFASTPEALASAGLLSARAPVTGMGFDPASAWTSINVGFSPDEQGISVLSRPAPEILAAVGLQRCRPQRDEKRRGRTFVYRAWTDALPIAVTSAAVAGVGAALAPYEFRVVMRNAQYGNFGWAKLREEQR